MATGTASLRDWLLANDPAFSRLRTGLRVTLTVCLSVAVLAIVHVLVAPLPKAAYALAITLSIQSGLSVKDQAMRAQFVTRLLGCGVCMAVVTTAALLEGNRLVSDLAFLVLIFAATYARAFGPRGFALGMFAFMSYFIGAYLKPASGSCRPRRSDRWSPCWSDRPSSASCCRTTGGEIWAGPSARWTGGSTGFSPVSPPPPAASTTGTAG